MPVATQEGPVGTTQSLWGEGQRPPRTVAQGPPTRVPTGPTEWGGVPRNQKCRLAVRLTSFRKWCLLRLHPSVMQGLQAYRVTESLTFTKKTAPRREGEGAGKPEGAGTAWGQATGTPTRIRQVPLTSLLHFPQAWAVRAARLSSKPCDSPMRWCCYYYYSHFAQRG